MWFIYSFMEDQQLQNNIWRVLTYTARFQPIFSEKWNSKIRTNNKQIQNKHLHKQPNPIPTLLELYIINIKLIKMFRLYALEHSHYNFFTLQVLTSRSWLLSTLSKLLLALQ